MSRRFVGPVSIILDAALVALSLYFALYLRFDGAIPAEYLSRYFRLAPWIAGVSAAALAAFGVHRVIWRYVSIHTVLNIVVALTITSATLAVVNMLMPTYLFPRTVPVLFWMLQIFLVAGIRALGRIQAIGVAGRPPKAGEGSGRKRVLIFGAGDVGDTLVRDLMRAGGHERVPVGFVDDDPSKQGRTLHGLRVLGNTPSIPRLIRTHRIDEVIIAAPSAPSTLVSSIFRCCQVEEIGCKTVPSLANYVVGKSPLQQIRDVRIEDLLGRDPVEIDQGEVEGFLRGRRVLVTGAGGSIGSELCRQIAKYEPARLIALDHDENKLCYVSLDLRAEHPDLNLAVVVGDVKDREGVSRVMAAHEPEVIFHAAAHKHVSFMEENPRAAILNNVLGTRIVAECAVDHGVEKFVLISTDKAVNPTNVMGASKRLCEKVVTAISAEQDRTNFSAVRFGNVLGSAGSVIPILKRQIATGGPVTITHPEARRFFMTIPEASQLVIQAGALADTGKVFVLDMGEQVKVIDVARQLIRLSGFEPERDIPIQITGLRPGEKLFEELLTDDERTTASLHRKIFIWQSGREDWTELRPAVDELIGMCDRADPASIKSTLAEIVPEYKKDARVARVDEVPDEAPAAPTKRLVESSEAESELQIDREPAYVRLPRAVGRGALALGGLAVVGLLSIVHFGVSPRSPIFVRESRVGRNRRRGPRRMFAHGVSIERRGRDRRKRNVYGRPFERLRFNTEPTPGAPAAERKFYAFLRRHGLDRLPAVLHLLTGEMAVVGPRPDHVEAAANMPPEIYRHRFAVKPGITGLNQVLGASDPTVSDPRRQVEIDKFYVANRSIGLDLRILARSFAVVFSADTGAPIRLRDHMAVNAAVGNSLDTVGEKIS